MAEVTGLRNNALPYPVYGAPWGVVFPMLDADGDLVTGATTPDAEVSKNGDTFADCTNESTEIATNSGMYYLLLTATEMTADVVTVIAKSATAGMKTTPIVLYPAKLVTLRSGTVAANAGDGTTLQLDSSASAVDDYYNGCLLVGTIDSVVEARVISDYTGSSKVCTVSPAFNTAPDNNDTFVVYQPWGRQFQQSDLGAIGAAAISTTTAQLGVNTVQAGATAWASGAIVSGAFASGAITAAAIAADAIGASELAADAVTEIRSLASGTSDSGTTTTMVDAARTEGDNDYWKDQLIVFTSGTIAGQARVITGFNAASDTITFAPATTQTVGTQTYEIWPGGDWLRPTTSGRTLDVSAGGEAGVDWANVGSPTTSLALTGTTIATTQKVDIETIKTNPVVNGGTITFPTTATLASTTNITAGTITTATNVTTVNGLAAGVITATSIASDAITDAKVASDVTIASVTGAVGSVASGGITAASFAANAITAAKLDPDVTTELQAGLATATALATVDTVVDAIQVQTDKLTFTVANQVDSNIQYVNDVQVNGDGEPGTEWGP